MTVEAVGAGTSLADRKHIAGQRLVIGFEKPYVDDDLRKLIKAIQPAGFVLFARNLEEPAQVLELNRELASLVDPHYPALLCVDQEGGRVQRVRDPATVWPPMRIVGEARDLTAKVSTAMAQELRAMGFNLNFAPVADVDNNPANAIIGDRSFGRDPQTVAKHVVTFLKAHQDEGIIACAKHFPGHGDTTVDSHFDLPTVEKEERDLLETELLPFQAACHAGVGSVMTAHVRFPVWDEELPATLSPHIVPRFLRQRFAYDGLVFTDDLEMKAVADRWTIDEIVKLTTAALVDVMLCCRAPTLQLDAYEALVRAQEDDRTHERRAEDAAKRVDRLRERFFLTKRAPVPLDRLANREHTELAALVNKRVLG